MLEVLGWNASDESPSAACSTRNNLHCSLHSLTRSRAVALVVLISRSKLVPDFAITIHFLHLVITSLYTGRIPRHAMWWATMLASAALSAGLGIWGCQYRELQPVFFGGRRILGATPTAATQADGGEGAGNDDVEGDEEMGFSRGRGRGRGRDGAGEYEMAQMEPTR